MTDNGLEKVREALEFYADAKNWQEHPCGYVYLCEREQGAVAREALSILDQHMLGGGWREIENPEECRSEETSTVLIARFEGTLLKYIHAAYYHQDRIGNYIQPDAKNGWFLPFDNGNSDGMQQMLGDDEQPTHWFPIPAPPKEGEKC